MARRFLRFDLAMVLLFLPLASEVFREIPGNSGNLQTVSGGLIMASGRMLKNSISLNERVNGLSLHSALLYTWMITHADDFGRMHGSAKRVRATVVPMRDDFPSDKVESCLREMQACGLLQRYEIQGEIYICFPSWDEHQTGLHKRTKSKIPDPIPGDSGKFREIPASCAHAEQNRTEQEQEQETTPTTPAHPGDSAADFGDASKVPVLPKGEGDPLVMVSDAWEPSEHFDAMLFKAGIKLDDETRKQRVAEFVSYRIKRAELKTQADWDHLLLQACIRWKSNSAQVIAHKPKQPAKSALHTFDGVDYSYGVNPDGSF